ncbi:MAG: hypothetical protein HC902_11990 [Calothrix sp. SM1_5_4]|nr:hypothetical protein [Calothrix sp. SM1_5_4]
MNTAVAAALKEALAQDELKEQNPYAGLSSLDPIRAIFDKGVSVFSRQTYRSSEYTGESGYDVVHYEIEHPDKSKSSILAYLERMLSQEAAGSGSERIPMVLITGNEVSVFREGILLERGSLAPEAAEELVASRLAAAVPFLSVSH